MAVLMAFVPLVASAHDVNEQPSLPPTKFVTVEYSVDPEQTKFLAEFFSLQQQKAMVAKQRGASAKKAMAALQLEEAKLIGKNAALVTKALQEAEKANDVASLQ